MVAKQKKRQQHREKKHVPVQPATDPMKWWKDRKTVLYLLGVLALTFIVMSPSLQGDFVNWDDDVNVYDNRNVQDLSADNVKKIFTTTIIGNYNPLTILSFAVEHHFFGLDPFYYHLNNIILHLICTLLVFWLMLLLGVKVPWAIFITILFGIQPMRVESVAWITERKDVLFAAFYLASLVNYVLFLKRKRKKNLLLVYLFFIPALLAKIQAVSLPLSMLAIDYLLNRPLKIKLVVEKIPYFLLSLAAGIAGIYFLQEQASLNQTSYSFLERIMIASYSLVVYVVKSMIPYEMTAIYPFPIPGEFGAIYYISLALLAGLAYLVYYSARHTRRIVFGSLFFLFNIMFLLQAVNAGQGFTADRFTYVPYLGLFYIYGTGLGWLYDHRKKYRAAVVGVVLVATVAFSVLAWQRAQVWRNTDTLFTDVIEKDRNIGVAYNNRGRYYRELKQFDKAIDDFSNLIRLRPDEARTYITRGRLYTDMGELEKAMADFNRALELNSEHPDALANRGAVYGMQSQYGKALADLNRSLEINPKTEHALINRSLVFYSLGRYEEALKDCLVLYELNPRDSENINMIGVCKSNLGDNEGALQYYTLAIETNPANGVYYQNRSFLYNFIGEKEKAAQDATKARQLGVNFSQEYLEGLKEE